MYNVLWGVIMKRIWEELSRLSLGDWIKLSTGRDEKKIKNNKSVKAGESLTPVTADTEWKEKVMKCLNESLNHQESFSVTE